MAISPAGTAVLWVSSVETAAQEASAAINAVAVAARRNFVSGQASSDLLAYIDNHAKPKAAALEAVLGQPLIAVLNDRQRAKLFTASEQIIAASLGIDNALELISKRGVNPLGAALEGIRACLSTAKELVKKRVTTEERRAAIAKENLLDPSPIETITTRLRATPEGQGGDLMRAAEAHLVHVEEMVTLMRQVIHEEVFEIGERIPQRKPYPSTVFEQHVRDDWHGLLNASSGAGEQWAQAFARMRADYGAQT